MPLFRDPLVGRDSLEAAGFALLASRTAQYDGRTMVSPLVDAGASARSRIATRLLPFVFIR
jgi:hypothetical protein